MHPAAPGYRTTRAISVRAALLALLASVVALSLGAGSPATGQIPVVDGPGTLAQVLGVPGVVFVDRDAGPGGGVVVGKTPATPVADVVAALERAGVAGHEVQVVVAEPITQVLSDQARPLVGGIQIQFPIGLLGLSTATCTLGFVAESAGFGEGFVTASHCSAQQGSPDGTQYWQPSRSLLNLFTGGSVAQEVADPGLFTAASDPRCPVGRRCRYSDAAFAASSAGERGAIARPEPGSTSWDGVARYRVVAEAGVAEGDTLGKVGRSSGHTAGPVTHACVDVNVSGTDITLLCQHLVAAGVLAGDSGSPVFTELGPGGDAGLVGLLWGATVVDGHPTFAFSDVGAIESELGALDTAVGP